MTTDLATTPSARSYSERGESFHLSRRRAVRAASIVDVVRYVVCRSAVTAGVGVAYTVIIRALTMIYLFAKSTPFWICALSSGSILSNQPFSYADRSPNGSTWGMGMGQEHGLGQQR